MTAAEGRVRRDHSLFTARRMRKCPQDSACYLCNRSVSLIAHVHLAALLIVLLLPHLIVHLPQMLLQVEIPAEPLGAVGASERLLLTVGVHVEGQVVRVVERLGALGAAVSLLAAVGEAVVLVVAVLVEALAADLTHVGLEA